MSGVKCKNREGGRQPRVVEGQVRGYLKKLYAFKSAGSTGTHLRVLKELAQVMSGALALIPV